MTGQLDLVDPSQLARVAEGVSATAAERIIAATSPNTMRAYARIWDGTTKRGGTPPPEAGQGFLGWCHLRGVAHLPASEDTFREWVNHLCDRGLAPSSVAQAMACVRTMHTLAGYEGQPSTRAADLVFRGYKRQRARNGAGGQRKAPPLSPTSLALLVHACDPATLVGARDRLVLTLGYGLMGRRSELCALTIGDVAPDDDEGLLVYIGQSKTDQDAEGDEIAVPREMLGDVDPVAAWSGWTEALASRGITTGRLLRSIDRHGRLGDKLSEPTVNRIIKSRAAQAGLKNPDSYSAHSLRAGGLTAALRAGVPLGIAARHGRWAEGSPVVNGYARTESQWRDNAMRATS